MTQTERIAHYETLLNRVVAAQRRLDEALEAFAQTRPLVRALDGYYGSADWCADLAADEAGRLPAALRRGVLSQDAVYDALTEDRALRRRMREIAAAEENAQAGLCDPDESGG